MTADQYFRELAQGRVDHSTEKTFRGFLAPVSGRPAVSTSLAL